MAVCANPTCFGGTRKDERLCVYCARLKDAAILASLCLAGSALIVCVVGFL